MSGKEKLYFLLNRIDDQRVLTPSGQPILIHPMGELAGNYPDLELLMLFKKLQDDEKVLKVTRTPLSEEEKGYNPRYEDDYFGLELLPAFDEYFAKIQNEPEYQEFTDKKPASRPQEPTTKVNRTKAELDVICWVTFTQTREILLNNVFLIGKPDFDSENEVVFGYLYNNPNKTITLDELKKELKRDITKTLHKIVENLGFRGDIKNLFFSISKNSIKFKKQITQKDLEELGLKRIRLILK